MGRLAPVSASRRRPQSINSAVAPPRAPRRVERVDLGRSESMVILLGRMRRDACCQFGCVGALER